MILYILKKYIKNQALIFMNVKEILHVFVYS